MFWRFLNFLLTTQMRDGGIDFFGLKSGIYEIKTKPRKVLLGLEVQAGLPSLGIFLYLLFI